MNPTTKAGKAHAEAWIDAVEIEWGLGEGDRESMLGVLAVIEAEAVAAERERIAEAVRRLDGECHDGEGLGCDTSPCVVNVSRAAVLAEINRRMKP